MLEDFETITSVPELPDNFDPPLSTLSDEQQRALLAVSIEQHNLSSSSMNRFQALSTDRGVG